MSLEPHPGPEHQRFGDDAGPEVLGHGPERAVHVLLDRRPLSIVDVGRERRHNLALEPEHGLAAYSLVTVALPLRLVFQARWVF